MQLTGLNEAQRREIPARAFCYAQDHNMKTKIRRFVEESNRIEGIETATEHDDAMSRLSHLLTVTELTVDNIIEFNTAGELRNNFGMDVMVGSYIPPKGNTNMKRKLECVLKRANAKAHPYDVHVEFETLHPFMDGNGRTGRAIWLWQMWNQRGYDAAIGFLHLYYYQSLDASRA